MNKTTHPIEPEELMAYLDGELPAERAAEAAAHVGECAECKGVISELRSTSHALRTWEVRQPESEIPQGIAAALAERQEKYKNKDAGNRWTWRRMRQRQPLLRFVGVLATVVVLVVGTIKFIGGNANNVFSQVAQNIDENGQPIDLYKAVPNAGPSRPETVSPQPPSAAPAGSARSSAKREVYGYLGLAGKQEDKQGGGGGRGDGAQLSNGPMIIRTAELQLIPKDFDRTRIRLEEILKVHRGYIGELKTGGGTGSGRWLTATLRVPSDQLDSTLADLKSLGRVESESQGGQDVTSQYVDLQARLGNARNTEKRLTDLLSQRTGKLSDVLEVEREVDRVRGEIERMEAERKNMATQVSFATVNLSVAEEYKAKLEAVPPSTPMRLSNAAIEGYRSMVDGIVSVILFLLSNGPSWLFWGAVLFLPGRFAWKSLRRRWAQ